VLLFAAIANIGCRIFTYANEKFTNVFVRAFTKSDATGLHLGKPSYRLENCHATLRFYVVCVSAPNCFGVELYDIINYKDVISANNSLMFVKDVHFTYV